ncbi:MULTISPECIES: helix-turn-helix domain-containing protein [unclassified Nocardioides]|uniref:helix-turn-helix domain-containing protein n=1 Tax=unclassified Nocardioides TaxID=2615069 RepID=UPI001910D6FE|nr:MULTISPECIES: helix-turn-helix transcriptional regulator [unclassified Nocardioides]
MVREKPAEEPSSPKTGDLALGRRIADRRDELGLSRKDLASATGLSYPYIAQIETGYRSPSMKHQFSIARALGLSLDDLFSSPDDQTFPGSAVPAPPAAPPPRLPSRAPSRSLRTTPRRTTIDEVIEHAVTEIESLPVSVRLEALSRIQLRIMQGVTEEQARRQS